MRNVFNMDSPLMRFLSWLADLVILNLCFLIGSLPLVTAGASLTALYSVCLKMVRNEESGIFTGFWKAWKANLRQSTLAWLLVLAFGTLTAVEFGIIRQMTGGMRWFFLAAWVIIAVLAGAVVWYVFPYMARFEDRLTVCIANAFRFSALHILYTLASLAVLALFIAVTLWTPETFAWMLLFWLMLGFALTAYTNSVFMRKFFAPFENATGSP